MKERESRGLMIDLRGISKTYQQGTRSVTVLKGVSAKIGKSEFVSIMGPSGSGKSTLLNLIGAMDVPTAGEIFFEGRSLNTLSDDELTLIRRRKIGFVFQFFNLLPLMTAAENVALPLFLEGKRYGEVRGHVERLLEKVGLSQRSGHRPDQLSGGEMQRVAIARALAMSPPLLLADEPTGNLDS